MASAQAAADGVVTRSQSPPPGPVGLRCTNRDRRRALQDGRCNHRPYRRGFTAAGRKENPWKLLQRQPITRKPTLTQTDSSHVAFTSQKGAWDTGRWAGPATEPEPARASAPLPDFRGTEEGSFPNT